MGLFDRIKNVRLTNTEPNTVHNVGIDDLQEFDKRSEDWVKFNPPKIKPSIKNCRRASRFPTVYGILSNLIMKSLSSMVITGDDEEAVKHITEMDKVWDIRNMLYECAWANLVDGEIFYEKTISKDNHAMLRRLAFDGELNLIKKYYDNYGELEGYKQRVVRHSAITKFKSISFYEDYQDSEIKDIYFDKEEISNPVLIEIDGKGQSLVKNVIDLAYMVESMARMMPSIVFKSANIMVATLGNSDRKETKLDEDSRNTIANQLSDYHKKGVVVVPYGVELDLVGKGNVLPKIEEYIKSLKSMIYEGLVTPESLYSSESSNRSTAQVQLQSEKTGHVLFIQFIQQFLKCWIERDLIDRELELNGFEAGCVSVSFLTGDENLDNQYMKEADETVESIDGTVNEKGSTALTTNDNPYDTYNKKFESQEKNDKQ